MIDVEHQPDFETAGFAIAKIKAPEKPETEPKLDLAKVEQDLFDFFSKISGSIPDWVPVIPSYLKAKKAQWEANAVWRNRNLATGEKIENKSEALKLFLKKTFSGLWEEGKTAIDLLLLFGTAGSGNAVLGAEKIAAQQVGKQAGKLTLEGLSNQIAKLAAGGEGAAFDMLPGFFRGLGNKLANHPEQAKHLFEMANVFEKILNIPGAKPFLKESLAEESWWQKLMAELKSSQGRAKNTERIFDSAQRVNFTPQSNPV